MQSIQEIKAHLKQNSITYQQLSDKSGIPLNTLKNLFRGKTVNPRIDTMQAIERALGLAPTFTAEEKAMGVGARPIVLSDKENDWLDTLNRAEEAFGEQYVDGVMLAIKVNLNNLKK